MNYGYLRVSTLQQDVEAQKTAVSDYCAKAGITIDHWIETTISSRKSLKDRGINDLLASLKKNDLLIVSELSRLGRSILELSQIIDHLVKKRVRLVCIKQNIDLRYESGNGLDMASKILLNTFSMLAEVERDLISERTKYGLALAKQKGKTLGNPRISELHAIQKQRSEAYSQELKDTIKALVEAGYTQRKIADTLNGMNVKTAWEKEKWHQNSVVRLLKDLGLKTLKAKAKV